MIKVLYFLLLICQPLFANSLEQIKPSIIVNFGGEGEVEGAFNLNNMASPMRTYKVIPRLIEGDMLSTPIRSRSVDGVVCNRCPSQGEFRFAVAKEACRILKAGGRFKVWSSNIGGSIWLEALRAAGFQNVTLTETKVAVGTKALECRETEF